MRESLHIQEPHQKERERKRETWRRRSAWRSLASISSIVQFCRDLDLESLRRSLRGNLGEEEEEDENDVAPLSSNGKSITIAPPTTTTYPSPFPSSSDDDGDHDSTPLAIIDTRKRSQWRRFSLLRQWESWKVAVDESLMAPTGFLLLMVWGFGVCMFRCKWEWEYVLVSEREKWEINLKPVCF